jgi:hypothetical protein
MTCQRQARIKLYFPRRFDPHATQFIHFNQLSDFLSDIEPPLQIKKPNLLAMVYFDLPICRGNKVHCLDALHALVTHVLGEVDETEELKTVSLHETKNEIKTTNFKCTYHLRVNKR